MWSKYIKIIYTYTFALSGPYMIAGSFTVDSNDALPGDSIEAALNCSRDTLSSFSSTSAFACCAWASATWALNDTVVRSPWVGFECRKEE